MRCLAYITAKHNFIPPSRFGGIPGKSAQDALLTVMNDVETAWHHNKVVTMLTYDITGFFDTIPHVYLIQTMHAFHIPLPLVQWTHLFLQNRKATISLDGKQDHLSPINTGVPQGSCASPILVAYFTTTLNEAIHMTTKSRLASNEQISCNLLENHSALFPHTLYVDDGSISMAAHTREETTQIMKTAFETAHEWLRKRGLKTDQVKCKLIHFTKSNRGRHVGPGPSITIPMNTENETRTLIPAKSIKYLGMWIDSRLLPSCLENFPMFN